MKHKVIFVHGLNGSSKTDFFPMLAKELKKNDIDFDISDYPGGVFNSFPNADMWMEKLHSIVSKTTKPIILVGYSLGTRAILLYLEKYKTRVGKVILIASTPNTPLAAYTKGGRIRTFFRHTIDLRQVKKLSKTFICIHSKDDPSTKYEWGVELAKNLGGELISFEDRKHFSNPECAHVLIPIIKNELS